MASPKPLFIFDGNCQAQHLAALVDTTDAADAVVGGDDWGFLPSYRGRICRVLRAHEETEAISAAKARGAKVVQISQFSPFSKQSRARGAIQEADARVFFPEVRLWATSPQRFREAFKADFHVTRILELDLQSVRTSQEKAEFPVDVAGYIDREIRKRPLFHTVNHPSGAIFARILEGLSIKLEKEIAPNLVLEIAKDIDGREGLNFDTDHPVASEIRRDLQFDWGPTYETYIEMLSCTDAKNWDALEHNMAKYESLFSDDTQYWNTCALLGRARMDSDVAIPAFEQLLKICPGMSLPWILYAQFFMANRQMAKVRLLLDRSNSLLGDSGVGHGVAARILIMLRDLTQAEVHAQEYWLLASRNIQAALPLLQVLVRREKFEEARSLIAALQNRQPSEIDAVAKFVARLKKTDSLTDELEPIKTGPSPSL